MHIFYPTSKTEAEHLHEIEMSRLAKVWAEEWYKHFMEDNIFTSLLPRILDQYGKYIEKEPNPNATDRVHIRRIPGA